MRTSFRSICRSFQSAVAAFGLTAAFVVPALAGAAVSREAASVRVAGIVLKWVEGDLEANYERAERLIRQAARGGARIVATPESFLDGYAARRPGLTREELRGLAEPVPEGGYFERLQRLTDELDIYLVAAISEREGDEVFNSALLFGPEGSLIGAYRKKYLWPGEAHLYSSGDEMRVFATPYGNLGIMICFDRMQAPAVKELAARGADFVFNPSGGSWDRASDAVQSERSRDGALPIVFVHPVKFLVTGRDGSILVSLEHGSVMDDPAQEDAGTVGYFDLPVRP